MIWLLMIPVIIFFTFKTLWLSGFPGFHYVGLWDRNFLEWCFFLFVGGFISFIISLVPVGLACAIGSMPETHGIKDKEYPLVALREKDGIKGRFYFLGAGSIDDCQYYFWYRRDQNGAVSGGKTTREPGVKIYDTKNNDKPSMVTFREEYKNKKTEQWLWIIGIDMRDTTDFCPDFYIPKGSIKDGYSL